MIVLDTHALLWWLSDSSKLSLKARRSIQVATRRNAVTASAASVLEIATLVRRKRLILSMPLEEWLASAAELPELSINPITMQIAARAGSFGSEVHGDPVDRLIIATTQITQSQLVTADTVIRSLGIVPTVW
jgi:PIN domain nuclease of toxin-antitoxin system